MFSVEDISTDRSFDVSEILLQVFYHSGLLVGKENTRYVHFTTTFLPCSVCQSLKEESGRSLVLTKRGVGVVSSIRVEEQDECKIEGL